MNVTATGIGDGAATFGIQAVCGMAVGWGGNAL